jgi:hypothetical protein
MPAGLLVEPGLHHIHISSRSMSVFNVLPPLVFSLWLHTLLPEAEIPSGWTLLIHQIQHRQICVDLGGIPILREQLKIVMRDISVPLMQVAAISGNGSSR